MKKVLFVTALVLSSLMYKAADAQVSVHINIGQQPVWGPVGYDYVDYYYFPEADVYYNVPRGMYVYFDGRNWVFSVSLPGSRWSRFDPFTSYKVVVNEPDPFYRNDYWRSRYAGFRPQHQDIIYYSREPKYYVIERHPEHNRWLQSNRSNNDRFDNDRRNDNRTVFDNNGRNDNRNINQGRSNSVETNRTPEIARNDNRNFNQGRSNNVETNRAPEQARNDNRNFNQGRSNEAQPGRTIEQRTENRTNNNNNFGQRNNSSTDRSSGGQTGNRAARSSGGRRS